MSNRLKELLNLHLVKTGKNGLSDMAKKLNRSEITVRHWIRSQTVPSAHVAYLLALACGGTEELATLIGLEHLSNRAKEAA